MSLPMHPIPREGTETEVSGLLRRLSEMHPIPREGTETFNFVIEGCLIEMHPIPREGTETRCALIFVEFCGNASYTP